MWNKIENLNKDQLERDAIRAEETAWVRIKSIPQVPDKPDNFGPQKRSLTDNMLIETCSEYFVPRTA